MSVTTTIRIRVLLAFALLAIVSCAPSKQGSGGECSTRPEGNVPQFDWASIDPSAGWSEFSLSVDGSLPSFSELLPWSDGDADTPEFRSFRESSGLSFTFGSLRYVIPASPVDLQGLVVLVDGGSGSALWFGTTEGRLTVESLVGAGYAVLAVDLVPHDFSDFEQGADSNDNKWHNENLYEPHVAELEAAVNHVMDLIAPDGSGVTRPRLFSLGFSKGGGFISRAHRDLPVTAQVLFNTRGHPHAVDITLEEFEVPPSTMWILGHNDNEEIRERGVGVVGNRNELAEEHKQAIDDVYGGKLILLDLVYNYPTSPSELSFSRIRTFDGQDISPEESERLYEEMSTWQPPNDGSWPPLIIEPAGENGCPYIGRPSPDQSTMSEGGFDWDRLAGPLRTEVGYQVNELGGYHQISSEFTSSIALFFADATANAEAVGLP